MGEVKTKVYTVIYEIFTNSFFKGRQPLQCKVVHWQSGAIAKWRRFFLSSNLSYSNLVRMQTIQFPVGKQIQTINATVTVFFQYVPAILFPVIAPTSQARSVLNLKKQLLLYFGENIIPIYQNRLRNQTYKKQKKTTQHSNNNMKIIFSNEKGYRIKRQVKRRNNSVIVK